MQKCPYCAEEIQDDAIKCKHCQSMLNESSDKIASHSQLRPYSKWLLTCIFALSILAFFLTNVSITIPLVGKMNYSMYDVVKIATDFSKSQLSSDDTSKKKPTLLNIINNIVNPETWGENKATIPATIVLVSVFGLSLHYLFTIIWGFCTFALHETSRSLNRAWLVLAVQFPILFSIGMKIFFSELNSLISSSKDADNPFASLGASMMANSFSIEPGIVMWILMIVSILGLGIQFMDNGVVVKSHVNSGNTKVEIIEGLESVQKKLRKRTIIAIAGIIILIVFALAALDSTTNFDGGPNANISNNKQVEAPTTQVEPVLVSEPAAPIKNSDNSGIELTIKNYFQAVQDKRVGDAINMYCDARKPNIRVDVIQRTAYDTEYYLIESINVANNDGMRAETLVKLTHKKYNSPEENWEIYISLIKESGVWKIVSTPGKRLY